MFSNVVILVNLGANGGRAADRWNTVKSDVLAMCSEDARIIEFSPPEESTSQVTAAIADGYRTFISAGGDGSAHYLVNQIMSEKKEDARDFVLGGIGLGSSNDFIKPKKHFIKDIPTRLNLPDAIPADIGKAIWQDEEGKVHTRYFIANASLGVTAEANWLFNAGDMFINVLKKRWTNAAILYTAVRTILAFKNFRAKVRWEDQSADMMLSNIAVLKSPYISGSFCFDDPVKRDDGFLGINICQDMTKTELLGVLAGLARGKFTGTRNTITKAVKKLTLILEKPAALEMDGEVVRTKEVNFSVIPGAIHLMGL